MPKPSLYQPNSYTPKGNPTYDVHNVIMMLRTIHDTYKNLSRREQDFIDDSIKRVNTYHSYTKFTDAQVQWITNIYMDRT